MSINLAKIYLQSSHVTDWIYLFSKYSVQINLHYIGVKCKANLGTEKYSQYDTGKGFVVVKHFSGEMFLKLNYH